MTEVIPEGYEPAENAAAKDVAMDALERSLAKQGIDPYPDGDIRGGSIELIDLADDVVEALLKAGITVPEDLKSPFSKVE